MPKSYILPPATELVFVSSAHHVSATKSRRTVHYTVFLSSSIPTTMHQRCSAQLRRIIRAAYAISIIPSLLFRRNFTSSVKDRVSWCLLSVSISTYPPQLLPSLQGISKMVFKSPFKTPPLASPVPRAIFKFEREVTKVYYFPVVENVNKQLQ